MDRILAIAEVIASVRLSRTRLQSLTADAVPHDEAEGYRVQDSVHDLLSPQLGAQVGYKIGCTSAVMQQYLAIAHPCSGGIFGSGVHASGVTLSHDDYVKVGVECEIAVRLGRDVAASGAPFSVDTITDAIECYLPAIEVVDDRYEDWTSMGAPTLVADDFFAAGCMLGAPVSRHLASDLLSVIGRAFINDEEVGHGTGADVLGHPHNALVWLANHLASQGKHLRAGQIVLTGSLVKTIWLRAGDRVVMDLSSLGRVTADFA